MLKFIHDIRSKFKASFFLLLGFPLLLTGCNTLCSDGGGTACGGDEPVVYEQPIAKAEAKPSDAVEVVESDAGEQAGQAAVNLDGDMLFNLLVAEFAGNSGDIDASLAY